MDRTATPPRFTVTNDTRGAAAALALSAALAIGFLSSYWRAPLAPSRAPTYACGTTLEHPCRAG
jgi:hypothetical protein